MIYALSPNKRETPSDTSSLTSASLRSTSITRIPISEPDNTVAVNRRPKDNKIEVVREVLISYSALTSFPQTERLPTSSTQTATIDATIATLQSPPTYPTVSMTHRYYTIHTRETLRSLPTGSVIKYTPPPKTDRPVTWSSLAPEESVPTKRKGDLSAYRQLVSFQRSRRGQVAHTRESAATTVSQPQDLGLKVLVLGISNSCKTTLQKSMKIAFEDDDEQWRLSYKPDIYMTLESKDGDVPLEDCTKQ